MTILWKREEIPHEIHMTYQDGSDVRLVKIPRDTIVAPEGVSCLTCGNGAKYWPEKDYSMCELYGNNHDDRFFCMSWEPKETE